MSILYRNRHVTCATLKSTRLVNIWFTYIGQLGTLIQKITEITGFLDVIEKLHQFFFDGEVESYSQFLTSLN